MNAKDIKAEAAELIEKVKVYSGGELKCEEDMLRIAEIVLEKGNIALLEETAFHAKFADGLMKVIQTTSSMPDEKYFSQIKTEYAQSIEKVKGNISTILHDSSDFYKDIFEKKYFELSYTGLSNLNNLCADLSCVKLYFNDLKR